MELENANGPESRDRADLLAAWRGQVRELEAIAVSADDAESELLSQLRGIADDLARGPALVVPQISASVDASMQVGLVNEAIARADVATIAGDSAIASPFDLAALTAAIGSIEQAASEVVARAEGEFIEARQAIATEVAGIRESLAAELKALRAEVQRSQRRAARRSTDLAGPRILDSANESPVVARLADVCAQLDSLRAQTQQLTDALPTQAQANSSALGDAMTELRNFIDGAVSSLRQDVSASLKSANDAAAESLIAVNAVHATIVADAREQSERLSASLRAELSTSLKEELSTALAEMRKTSRDARGDLHALASDVREQASRNRLAEQEAAREVAALREAADAKRIEDDHAALQRAVAMLAVLESLDDALHALRREPDAAARDRIAHFERQARAMASLVELDEIATDGEFDEDRHEIVGVLPLDGDTDGAIEVRQRGYTFRGRVIRRAQVVVSAASLAASCVGDGFELTL